MVVDLGVCGKLWIMELADTRSMDLGDTCIVGLSAFTSLFKDDCAVTYSCITSQGDCVGRCVLLDLNPTE